MTDIDEVTRRSWRRRRRVKRLLFSWVVITFFCAEAGASWFGIFIAEHAPMSIAEAKLIAERTAMAVILVSSAATVLSAILQFRARQILRRIENTRLRSAVA
jgi:biotin transporter BioY